MSAIDMLYIINDALSALASDLGVEWSGDAQEELVLQELTYLVANGFGIEVTL